MHACVLSLTASPAPSPLPQASIRSNYQMLRLHVTLHNLGFILWKLKCANIDMRMWITTSAWLSFTIRKWNHSSANPHISFVPFFFITSFIFLTFILLSPQFSEVALSLRPAHSSFHPLTLTNSINTILSYIKLLYLIYCIRSLRHT